MKRRPPKVERHSAKDVKGKHTRNPGYQPGNHWMVCDLCGFDIRSKDAKEMWNGLWVCPIDWTTRHPQDFVRGVPDEIAAAEPVRPPGAETFVPDQPDRSDPIEGDIPPGTNDNSL